MTKRSLTKPSWSSDQCVRFIVSLLMAPLLHRSPASSATSSDSCRAEELDKQDILFNNIFIVFFSLFAELLPATDRHDGDDNNKPLMNSACMQ
jgi:hypothetical protein